jgi:hypothetical protein
MLCFTPPLLLPGSFDHPDLPCTSHPTELHKVCQLSTEATRLLWHQRLAHCSDDKLANAHKFVTGVPQFRS